ncbi:hypothetical protein HG531_005491 [Fusarium graminearum]|nr:hypothetical protein HG531_005491 [Fusarium graminearum]
MAILEHFAQNNTDNIADILVTNEIQSSRFWNVSPFSIDDTQVFPQMPDLLKSIAHFPGNTLGSLIPSIKGLEREMSRPSTVSLGSRAWVHLGLSPMPQCSMLAVLALAAWA